jgi:DNA ligase-associated metallophosphoesterase
VSERAAISPAAAADAARRSLELTLAGRRAVLLAERALWLPELATVLVADVHIGKAASFRRLGTPVPEATTAATLARLSAVLRATRAAQLVVLGDLQHSVHAQAAAPAGAFGAWRAGHAELALTLVAGNHDQRAGAPPPAWRVQVVDEPHELAPGLALVHHPRELPLHYALAGHVHPAVVLAGRGPGAVRLPCFHFGPGCGVLPAFGEFTGSHVVRPLPGERVFVVAEGEVREWPVAA